MPTIATPPDNCGQRLETGGLAVIVLLASFALLAASCERGEDQPPLPQGPPAVEVAMRDHAFDYDEPVPAGRVVFHVTNQGDHAHDLVLIRLPEQVSHVGELLDSPEPRGLPPVYSLPAREPGESAMFAAELSPGRYAMICFVEAADDVQHHEKGMVGEFEVSAHAPVS